MGTLNVYFVGICTHLREFTSRETEHRVVLINARDGKVVAREAIVGHTATLRYLDRDGRQRSVPLDGKHVTVKNATTTAVTYDESFFSIPRLTHYAPKLGSLSPDVANGGKPELVAAYFDAIGRFVGRVDDNDASVAVMTVATDGAPKLQLANFPLHLAGPHVETLDLPDDASIQIENVGPGKTGGDRPQDFLLNYLVAQRIPMDATWPTEPAKDAKKVALPFVSNTVDPGCSNSNYP